MQFTIALILDMSSLFVQIIFRHFNVCITATTFMCIKSTQLDIIALDDNTDEIDETYGEISPKT